MVTVQERLPDFDERVEQFEAAWARGDCSFPSIGRFLPDGNVPGRLELLVELLRIALEVAWSRGEPPMLDEILNSFPEVRANLELLAPLAFEDYRLRVHHGRGATPDEYASRFGIDVSLWPVLSWQQSSWCSFADTAPEAADRMEVACRELPDSGAEFAGFELLAELGRGAFARVFLARQTQLADRLVALKITAGPTGEPRRLARLQHGNVVPIYSLHQQGRLTAVCMPYLGNSTLADVIRGVWPGRRRRRGAPLSGKSIVTTLAARRSLVATLPGIAPLPLTAPLPSRAARLLDELEAGSYVEAVVRLAARVAEGLAHAHDRGILHRDLKPANILLADDGEPLILDFNLATDVTPESGGLALVGGTLPYMAPEQLAVLAAPRGGKMLENDPSSDLFSLGVALFELLTGQLPHELPRGSVESVTAALQQAWTTELPSLRQLNSAVPRGVEAIVWRCLATHPGDRYRSAHELREDLTRQLEHRPLRYANEPWSSERITKWSRRHPRIASATTVSTVALAIIALLGAAWFARGQRLERVAAEQQLQAFEADLPAARVLLAPGVQNLTPAIARDGVMRGQQALQRYQVRDDAQWQERPAVRLLEPEQRSRLLGEIDELQQLLAATQSPAITPASETAAPLVDINSDASPLVRALRHSERGELEEAVRLLQQTLEDNPRDAAGWLTLGYCHVRRNDLVQAEVAYSMCQGLVPDFYVPLYFRGLARLERKQFAEACEDFTRTLRLYPALAEAFFHRALAEQGLADHLAAVDDFSRALDAGLEHTRTFFLRARSLAALGRREAAEADRAEGLRRAPTDAASYLQRGLERLTSDPPGAESDFSAALRLDPTLLAARANLAHVLAEKLGKTDEALACLSQWIARHPRDPLPLGSRAVLRARRGEAEVAVADADAALRLSRSPFTLYQAGCAYALSAAGRDELLAQARGLLAQALDAQPSLALDMRADSDLATLRGDNRFQRLLAASLVLVDESRKVPAGTSGSP